MLSWFQKRRLTQARPTPAAFSRAIEPYPVLTALDPERQARLLDRATELLASKSFLGTADFEPQPEDILAVAALAALPVLELGADWYRGFHTFILYPGEYLAEVEEVDDDGLVHSGTDLRSGEAWAHGPVVLGMAEVRASGQGEGFNVVIHELAHQIDQLNGDMDGFPPLHEGMNPTHWTETFSAAYERLDREMAQNLPPSLDPYALESPAEFFAVACEHFFDTPDWLAEQYPALFDQLRQLFRQTAPQVPHAAPPSSGHGPGQCSPVRGSRNRPDS